MFIFRVLYGLVITAIFIFYRDTINVTIYNALIYSAIVFLGIFIVDLLASGVRNYKFLSAFISASFFLILGFVITQSFRSVFDNEAIRLVCLFIFIYIGIIIGYKNSKIFENFFGRINIKVSKTKLSASTKLIDTSTLIDGRIANIVESDFMEGSLVIPVFVLKELQNVADSHDHLRRQKGRRGLNVLKRLQEQTHISVEIDNTNFDDIGTVDEKLIEMAKKINAGIMTTDFNLMKVAEIQNIKVLNLNNLAIALRQTILPGEELQITVAKEGKDPSQGVGYLDDGTMVVVEQGRKNIGETLKVEVTSLLQTESGRIIFSRVKQ